MALDHCHRLQRPIEARHEFLVVGPNAHPMWPRVCERGSKRRSRYRPAPRDNVSTR